MSDEAHDEPLIHHHISPLSLYYKVFAALMVLTFITVAVARVDFGFFNVIVAITIGTIKATLVALFFMHLKYSARVTWVAAGAGAIWLVIMLALTLSDVLSRSWLPPPESWL